MPLVVAPDPESDLSQGDILKNVPFAVTETNGNVVPDRLAKFALVISRPCKALREDSVVVAPIVKFRFDLTDLLRDPKNALDRTRRALSGVRDGVGAAFETNDNLYLGTLEPGSNARFSADLLVLSTARVPTVPAERQTWIGERRIGRLSDEFLRDLHVRMFVAYSRLGFDDYAWFPDADLDVIISAGQAELVALDGIATLSERAIQQSEMNGATVSTKQREAAATDRLNVDQHREKMAPYLAERSRRATGK